MSVLSFDPELILFILLLQENLYYPMLTEGYIIDIVPERRPFNCYMVVPLNLLQSLAPLLKEEIYSGKIGSDNQDRVILHLLLGEERIAQVERILEEKRIRA